MTGGGRSGRPAVEFRDVSKTFGGTRAVDAISFTVLPGEFFSLLGPSGCGKTTTLRLIAGFERPDPDRGLVLIGDQVVNTRPPYQRGVGMVFQSYALFPHLSVAANVAFGLEQRRAARDRIGGMVARALELVRLDPARYGSRMPSQLSGGERQRVALARALVLEPQILLLDEPLGALDLKLRKEMQLELKALNRSLGATFIYVTHDQEEALTMSDRIAVMGHARIAQLGTPAEIYENPRTEFVAEFIGEANVLKGRLVGWSDGPMEAVRSTDQRGRPDQSAKWIEIEMNGSRFIAPAPVLRRPDDLVSVAIRPEWLDLFRPGEVPSAENALPGVVRQVIYLGETIHVLVALDAGQVVRVALRNEGQLSRPIAWQPESRVAVAWLPEDCQVLEPEP